MMIKERGRSQKTLSCSTACPKIEFFKKVHSLSNTGGKITARKCGFPPFSTHAICNSASCRTAPLVVPLHILTPPAASQSYPSPHSSASLPAVHSRTAENSLNRYAAGSSTLTAAALSQAAAHLRCRPLPSFKRKPARTRLCRHFDRSPVRELSFEQLFCERIFHVGLDRSLYRPRTERGIVALIGEEGDSFVVERNFDPPVIEPVRYALELVFDDARNAALIEAAEHDDFVDAV